MEVSLSRVEYLVLRAIAEVLKDNSSRLGNLAAHELSSRGRKFRGKSEFFELPNMNLIVLGASLAILTIAGGVSVTQIQAKTTQSTPGVKELTIKNQSDCSPAYPDVCIRPPVPYSFNCKDITERDFRVLQLNDPMPINPYGYDPHGFDRNKNRVGCETITSGGRTHFEDE